MNGSEKQRIYMKAKLNGSLNDDDVTQTNAEEYTEMTEETDDANPDLTGDPTDDDQKRRRYLLLKTLVLGLIWAANGAFSGITVATIPDLKYRVHVNYEELSRALAAFGLGVIVAAPLGGVMSDRWIRGRDVQIVSFLGLTAITIGVRPWIESLWFLGVMVCLEGFFRGLFVPGMNNMLDRLWGKDIGLPRHLMSVCWVIGELVSPLICKPFFLDLPEDCDTMNASLDCIPVDQNNMTRRQEASIDAEVMSEIEYPYLIITLWATVPIVLLSLFYYFDRTSGQKYYKQLKSSSTTSEKSSFPSWREIFSPKFCGQGSTSFGVVIIMLLFMYYFACEFMATPFYKFIMAYAVEKIGMSKSEAATLMILIRIIAIFLGIVWGALTRCIRIQFLLFIQIFGELAVVIYFNIVEIHTKTQLYAFIVAFSVMSVGNWATGITWGLRYIEFSSLIYTVIEVSAAIASLVSTWATGYVLEYGGHEAMLRLQLGSNIAFCFVVIVMQIVGSWKGEKFKDKNVNDVGCLNLCDRKSPLLSDQDDG
ncbi:unnamed protein product [Owenia fusiformis]|uniref:Uncharacterized protein n=1 Tax=Owenia fusiformis TaxID=6347 RepID=A0A8S4Q8K2_OWEFU|nr:unnamed protein product [Owenia fusiformis]